MEATDKTILLIDDDQAFLSFAQEALQSAGYRVITRADGRAALFSLDEGLDVDLIITDYKMPGMDGLKFLSALRSRALSMPVIMLSAYGGIETYIKALNLDAYEFVSKPISINELNAIVASALNSPLRNNHRAFANAVTVRRLARSAQRET